MRICERKIYVIQPNYRVVLIVFTEPKQANDAQRHYERLQNICN